MFRSVLFEAKKQIQVSSCLGEFPQFKVVRLFTKLLIDCEILFRCVTMCVEVRMTMDCPESVEGIIECHLYLIFVEHVKIGEEALFAQ